MTIKIDLQFEGAWKIGFLVEDGKDRVREYLEDLIKRHKHQELKWLLAEMKLFCDRGPHPSKKTFAPEGNGIFAIKSHQQRIYGFFDGKNFFPCVAGTTKKTQKADPELLKIVRNIKQRYEMQKKIQHGS